METLLEALFGLQRFEDNEQLRRVIDSVHDRYQTEELSMDEMESISAAGTPLVMPETDDQG